MNKLPIGIQSFEKIRREGYVYVDKTAYIWEMISSGNTYFLSRPRRFGKSLLVSTIAAYFLGQKDLFDGLIIADRESRKPAEEQWLSYPVLMFSLSGGAFQDENGFANTLSFYLDSFATGLNFTLDHSTDLPNQLRYCIQQAYQVTGRQVVVLIDEYDKPLLENMNTDPEQEERNRALFKSFFNVLKDMDQYLKFIFITGVTKFSKVSIFSDMNQLNDISMSAKYAAVCGITEEELISCFPDEINALANTQGMTRNEAVQELARMYDGYHFSENPEGVYNPFSLLKSFSEGQFGRYWFETGTPTFLIKELNRTNRLVVDFSEGVTATKSVLSNYYAHNPDPVPLYYQTGYLTITAYNPEFKEYTLSYPNDEVKYGYLESLIPAIGPDVISPDYAFSASRMTGYLKNGDTESFVKMLQALLASIPYYEGKAPAYEQQWRNIIFAVFTFLGQYVRTEVHSSGGRSDCVVENAKYIYIFEFKMNQPAEKALEQIEEKSYAEPYTASGKKIIRIGVSISSEKGTIEEWQMV